VSSESNSNKRAQLIDPDQFGLNITLDVYFQKLLSNIQTDKLGIILTYDGWKNVKKESLLGIAIINSKGKTLIWGAEDISGKRT
ncbi:23318_t:CDS:2, partial [Gigaspora rosea]